MNKVKFRNKLSFFALIGILFSCIDVSVLANSETDRSMGFTVEPIHSVNQIDQGFGYYYLKTEPGKEQIIEAKLKSSSKETKKIQLIVMDAFTGINGALAYGVDGEQDLKIDETLKNPTSEIVTPVTEFVELASGEEKIVTFKVKPPEESYEGVKIGQVYFRDVTGAENREGVNDTYQYGINIVLSENGDDFSDGSLTNIKLNEIKATVKRGHRMVTANIQNPMPKRVIDSELSGTITKKGSQKIVKKVNFDDFQFAPNSNVDLEINWGLAEIQAGEYTLNLKMKNSYDEVRLTKDFRITGKTAKELNKKSAFKIQTPTWVKIIALVTSIYILNAYIYIVLRNKRWTQESRKNKKNKKRNKRT